MNTWAKKQRMLGGRHQIINIYRIKVLEEPLICTENEKK